MQAPRKNRFLNSQFRALLNLIISQSSHGLTQAMPKAGSRWEKELPVPQADRCGSRGGVLPSASCAAQQLGGRTCKLTSSSQAEAGTGTTLPPVLCGCRAKVRQTST